VDTSPGDSLKAGGRAAGDPNRERACSLSNIRPPALCEQVHIPTWRTPQTRALTRRSLVIVLSVTTKEPRSMHTTPESRRGNGKRPGKRAKRN